MNGKELESINVTSKYEKEANKYKETLGTYINKAKAKTSSTSENKEKPCDSYFSMYECGKNFLHSTYECAFTSKSIYISRMEKLMVE